MVSLYHNLHLFVIEPLDLPPYFSSSIDCWFIRNSSNRSEAPAITNNLLSLGIIVWAYHSALTPTKQIDSEQKRIEMEREGKGEIEFREKIKKADGGVITKTYWLPLSTSKNCSALWMEVDMEAENEEEMGLE